MSESIRRLSDWQLWTTFSSAWSLADTRPEPRAIRHADTNDDLVWERRIRHCNAQGVDVIEGPVLVLVPERQIDETANTTQFHNRGHEYLTAADRSAHGFSQSRMQECRAVLCRAMSADGGGLAVADGRRIEGGHGLCGQLRAKRCAEFE